MNLLYKAEQTQVSDELYIKIYRYIKIHNITPKQFAEKCELDYYLFKKAVDRHIKMKVFQTLIDKLEEMVTE